MEKKGANIERLERIPEQYHTHSCDIKSLSFKLRNQMVDLYLEYYTATNHSLFFNDLGLKSGVLLLFYCNKLVGFTTYEIYSKQWQGKDVIIVYSGDTIVHKPHWGQQTLAKGWIRKIAQVKHAHPHDPIYWFLIVKGHRTYKYLPAFTCNFYPHWKKSPNELKPLLDELALEKFKSAYDMERGVIAYKEPRGKLKDIYASPQENELGNNAVQFFLQKNPYYKKGEELACLCSLDETNLRPLTKRILASCGAYE